MKQATKYKKIRDEYDICVLNFKKIPIERIAIKYNKRESTIIEIINKNRHTFQYSEDNNILNNKNESYYTEEEMLMDKPLYKYDTLSIEEKIIYVESTQEEGVIKFNQLIKYNG